MCGLNRVDTVGDLSVASGKCPLVFKWTPTATVGEELSGIGWVLSLMFHGSSSSIRFDGRYTERNMSEYAEQWQDYRRRRNLRLFAFIGYVPAIGVFGIVTELLFNTDRLVLPSALCWMAFCAFANMMFYAFRCPRCGNKFFVQRRLILSYTVFTQRCVHCGLPKYAGEEPHAS